MTPPIPRRAFTFRAFLLLLLLPPGCAPQRGGILAPPAHAQSRAPAAANRNTIAERVVAGARAQIGDSYDPSYVRIPYPNGDVAKGAGVCTDVVVRALRAAGHDLQRLIHQDMRRHFARYPRKWGLRRPDRNIDHRRVPNQMTFFARHGQTLPKNVTPATLATWQPGDIVCWKLDNGLDHTGVISDRKNENGAPLVIHNIARCAEDDCLTRWKITGHFRYPKRKD